MKTGVSKVFALSVFLIGAVAVIGWIVFVQFHKRAAVDVREARPAPVEVAPVERGPIELRRTFSGELEAQAEFVVAPKVGGRVERVFVNIADTIKRGQVVAELDNDEYIQSAAQARADLLVAQANLSEARSALEIADREFTRTESLLKRGIASDSEFDAARQNKLAMQARLKVAEAQVKKAESSLETANIRLGYTRVTAGWSGGDEYRVAAERYVDEGQTVAANAPLLLVVELQPIVGVVFVAERDYARLKPGQSVSLTTDAWPGELFAGRIDRVAPIFSKSSRQARVETIVDNPLHRLKPGMFIKVTAVLDRVSDAIVVPEQALTVRHDKSGVFLVNEEGRSVAWREVKTGIRDSGRVQVEGQGISGRVVVLGQQLLNDGSRITIPSEEKETEAEGAKAVE